MGVTVMTQGERDRTICMLKLQMRIAVILTLLPVTPMVYSECERSGGISRYVEPEMYRVLLL